MKLDATPITIRATAEVFKLAAFLDDRLPHADRHRIAAWAEQIQRHNLPEGDLLDGLQAFYDGPADRPIGVGDLIQHARIAKRDRFEREADAERERRQADNDVKSVDEMDAVAGGVVMGPVVNRTRRLVAAESALQAAVDRQTAMDAIWEFFAAKQEARRATKPAWQAHGNSIPPKMSGAGQ